MAINVRQTISDDLFETWKKCRRHGDTKKIKEITGKSLPVIERALNSGFVVQDGLSETITYFFTKRLELEEYGGEKLKTMLE